MKKRYVWWLVTGTRRESRGSLYGYYGTVSEAQAAAREASRRYGTIRLKRAAWSAAEAERLLRRG